MLDFCVGFLCWIFVLDFCVGFLCWIFVLEKDLDNVLVPPTSILLSTSWKVLETVLSHLKVIP